MQSLIVHSRGTKQYAQEFAKKYKRSELLQISGPPDQSVHPVGSGYRVYGIGGGSVIDTAKLLALPDPCIAIPTTAAGASETRHAVAWTPLGKVDIPTPKPITRIKFKAVRSLPQVVQRDTAYDAIAHAVESLWSKKVTHLSGVYAAMAIHFISKFMRKSSHKFLIMAGIAAGQAIDITGTNAGHALTYPLTTEYGVSHGQACAMITPLLIQLMDDEPVRLCFKLDTTNDIIDLLRKHLGIVPIPKDVNAEFVATEAMKYDKFDQIWMPLCKKCVVSLLEKGKGK